jgi:hypothetical protein
MSRRDGGRSLGIVDDAPGSLVVTIESNILK